MTTWTAAASLSNRRMRSVARSAAASARRPRSHSTSAGRPRPSCDGDGLQPLPDVPQVGQPPAAVLLGEQPGRQTLIDDGDLEQRRHTSLGEQPAPSRAGWPRARRSGPRRRCRVRSRFCPRNGVSAAARTRPERCGCSRASSRISQSSPAGVAYTLPAPAITDGTSTAARASRTRALWSWVPTRTATSPATEVPSRRRSGAPASSAAMSAARSRRHQRAHRPHVDLCSGADPDLIAAHHPQPQRCR